MIGIVKRTTLDNSFTWFENKMASKAPKPWKLTEEESLASFKSWQHNIVFNLSREDDFKPFLEPNVTWLKASESAPLRGFINDTEEGGKTAQQKVNSLQHMLGLLTQWVPHYLATDIISSSTGIESIWSIIRKYYGFQQSEFQFMKYSSIVWEDGERPERLYQRIVAHLQDNLLCAGSTLLHNGITPTQNEELSPTVERLAVLRWMELLHPSLPALVQRTFAHDLQRMSLKDIQPQIVHALDGFMEELRQDDARITRVFAAPSRRRPQQAQQRPDFTRDSPDYTRDGRFPRSRGRSAQKGGNGKSARESCRVCRAEGRPYKGHCFFTCDYVSKAEKRNSIAAHQVDVDVRDQCHSESNNSDDDQQE